MRYLFFGGLNVIITWTTYALFVLAGIGPVIGNALSWIIGVSFAFVVNKLYVFNSRNTETKQVSKEATTFTAGRIITGVIALVGFPLLYNFGLNQSLFGVDGFPARMTISAIEIVLNYLFSKYLVFTKKD